MGKGKIKEFKGFINLTKCLTKLHKNKTESNKSKSTRKKNSLLMVFSMLNLTLSSKKL